MTAERHNSITPLNVMSHVAAWNTPSQNMFRCIASRVVGGTLVRQHAVPLQQLMQHDAVQKSPRAQHREESQALSR